MESLPDIKVFISHRDSVCGACGEELGRNAWITLANDKGALCLSCAELDHLVFLAPGNATLTRRAREASPLSAIVLKWSRSRKRYERQGIIVQEDALAEAEKKCLADSEARERRREREAVRREDLDAHFIERFAARVRAVFPTCPPGVEQGIANHACQKYSGRVGRSASAKALEEEAIRLAVIAHIRHVYTGYDALLGKGVDRSDARALVSKDVAGILRRWGEKSPGGLDDLPLINRTNLDSEQLLLVEREVDEHRSLLDVLRWAATKPKGTLHPQVIADVVTQDEYTHDVIVPWRDGLVLVYDTN